MSEDLSAIFYGLSFFLSLFVLVSLWWVMAKFPVTRRLWGLLALGGTLNLIADPVALECNFLRCSSLAFL